MAPRVDTPAPTARSLLDGEIAGYRALLRLLEDECDALRRVDADTLLSIAAAKERHIQALEELARNREATLRDAGLPASATGLRCWLAGASTPASVLDALLDLARAARDANRRNQRLMARQRRHYEAAFAALLRAAGEPELYAADGRMNAAHAGRARAAA
jgi:flagellar biosynthesis/type III secretory pathway chaperone